MFIDFNGLLAQLTREDTKRMHIQGLIKSFESIIGITKKTQVWCV